MGAAVTGAFGSPQDLMAAFPGGFQEIQALFQVPGRPGLGGFGGGGGGGGGGGFGGGQSPLAQTGDYLVTLRVGSVIQRQVLRLEHVAAGGSGVVLTTPDDKR